MREGGGHADTGAMNLPFLPMSVINILVKISCGFSPRSSFLPQGHLVMPGVILIVTH